MLSSSWPRDPAVCPPHTGLIRIDLLPGKRMYVVRRSEDEMRMELMFEFDQKERQDEKRKEKKTYLALTGPCWANLNRQTREAAQKSGKNNKPTLPTTAGQPRPSHREMDKIPPITSWSCTGNQMLRLGIKLQRDKLRYLWGKRRRANTGRWCVHQPSVLPPLTERREGRGGLLPQSNTGAKACQSHISSQVTTRQRRRWGWMLISCCEIFALKPV